MTAESTRFDLLIVEDDAAFARSLARLIATVAPPLRPVVQGGVAAALQATRAQPGWCGVISDHGLPDGTGFELIRHVTARIPGVPALLVTGSSDPRVTNRAANQKITVLRKPFSLPDLQPFLEEAAFFGSRTGRFRRLVQRSGLSPGQARVLALSVIEAKTRDEVAAELGVSVNTVKDHIRKILAKTGAATISDLRENVTRSEIRKQPCDPIRSYPSVGSFPASRTPIGSDGRGEERADD